MLWEGKTPPARTSLQIINIFRKKNPTNPNKRKKQPQTKPNKQTHPQKRKEKGKINGFSGQLKNQPHDHGISKAMSKACSKHSWVFLWIAHYIEVCVATLWQRQAGSVSSDERQKKGAFFWVRMCTAGRHKRHVYLVSSVISPQHHLSAAEQVKSRLVYTRVSSQFHPQNSGTISTQLIQKTACSPENSVFI